MVGMAQISVGGRASQKGVLIKNGGVELSRIFKTMIVIQTTQDKITFSDPQIFIVILKLGVSFIGGGTIVIIENISSSFFGSFSGIKSK